MNDIIIRAENLSYVYPFQKLRALDDVSFELRRGEAMLVTGASGCGKSTLLRILNGLIPEHFRGTLAGGLEIAGNVCPLSLERISRCVGTVLQCPEEQIMATTVEEEVALALEWQSCPVAEMRRRVGDAMSALGIAHLASRSVFSLSSGERQKCVIASVIAAQAQIVVMDEPTANLSPDATEELAGLVARLKGRGVSVVIVDHRLYWLKGVVDRLLVLKDGKAALTLERLGDLDNLEKLDGLEKPDPLDRLAAHPDFAAWGLRSINVSRPVLPIVDETYSHRPAVAIRNLSFRYKRKSEWIYRDFSAALPRGKIVAVVGANGAGKTTLARLLCGLLKPTSGSMVFHDGGSVSVKTPRVRRDRTAFVMQQMDIQLYMKTVLDELLYSAPRKVPKRERLADAEKWLDTFGLAHLRRRHPHSLSGGEKQRLVIACALMKRPALMILDEPTSGLDGRNMRIIADVLREYASSGGTVLLITHDLELLSLVADYQLEIKQS